jgi:competence protein ComFB
MNIHNTSEDLGISEVAAVCDTLDADGNQEDLCTCEQCRNDVTCYVLNRIEPHYVISHRGLARVNQETSHQSRADLTALVYEGIRRVSHNQRPYFDHDKSARAGQPAIPAFNLPTIMGKVFNGLNFSPMTGVKVQLLQNGKLANMKDANWQNPYTLISSTGGTFTFWPKPVPSETASVEEVFEFAVKIETPDFAELNHVFSISAVSELAPPAFSLNKTYKLPDLFLFPPGEEKNQLILNV